MVPDRCSILEQKLIQLSNGNIWDQAWARLTLESKLPRRDGAIAEINEICFFSEDLVKDCSWTGTGKK